MAYERAVRVLMVDDNQAFLRAAAYFLEGVEGMRVSTATAPDEAIARLVELVPDVVVVDLALSESSGLDLLPRLAAAQPGVGLVVLTLWENESYRTAALQAGAHEFVPKSSIAAGLGPAIRRAAAGMGTPAPARLNYQDTALLEGAERALRTEISYRSLLDDLSYMVFQSDAEHRLTYLSSAWSELTGGDLAHALGRPLVELFHEGDRQRLATELACPRPEGGPLRLEDTFRLLAADSVRWVEVKGRTYVDRDGHLSTVGTLSDVTAWRAREELLGIRARQGAVVAKLGEVALGGAAPLGLFEAAVGVVADTLCCELVLLVEFGGDDLAAPALRAVAGPAAGVAASLERELELQLEEGPTRLLGWLLAHGGPLLIPDIELEQRFTLSPALRARGLRSGAVAVIPGAQRPFGVLSAFGARPQGLDAEDATFLQAIAHVLAQAIERARAEGTLRLAQKMEAVGRLAGGIAHDFNNLLTVIGVFSDLVLLKTGANDPRRDDLLGIRNAVERAVVLTRALLAFSRAQPLVLEPVEMGAIPRDMIHMLARLCGEDVQLHLHVSGPPAYVLADRHQLEQVLLNLVLNARDALPKGGRIDIACDTIVLDEGAARHLDLVPGRYATMRVSDNGVGMDSGTLARVFEPFFTTKQPGRGTGLGLASSYGIVRQSGGNLSAASRPGEGSSFVVYVPVSDAPEPTHHRAPPVVSAGGGECVLLVEDDDAVRTVSRRVLADAGYKVIDVDSAAAALALLREAPTRFQLLLTDVVLSESTGVALAEEARTIEPTLRALLMSGYPGEALARRGVAGLAWPLLAKPFTHERLLMAVRDALLG